MVIFMADVRRLKALCELYNKTRKNYVADEKKLIGREKRATTRFLAELEIEITRAGGVVSRGKATC